MRLPKHWLWLVLLASLACNVLTPSVSAPASTAAPTAAPATVTQPANGAVPTAPAGPTTTPSAATPAADDQVPLDAATDPAQHPRLWLTPESVARYRSWAAAGNPAWADGLEPLAQAARADMDAGKVPGQDCGSVGYEEYATEMYAEFFAFLANVHPDAAQRADYAARARTLLMDVIDQAAQGPARDQTYVCNGNTQYPPFRHPDFFTADRDRARYHGEAFGLTVDWIYPSLSAADKAVIRKVFLRWSQDIVTRGYHHPEPVGLLNDPALLADPQQVRYAGNNYFTAHMRNLGLMALAFDPADDPGGQLRAYLDTAAGAYLYLFNHLIQGDARGGLLPEGVEYSPQTAAYAAQFLWALQTAGWPGAGGQVNKTFWSDFTTAYLHMISPGPVPQTLGGETLSAYQPVWYGDSQEYRLPDYIDAFGALDHLLDSASPRAALRWIIANTPAGGAPGLADRIHNPSDFRQSLLYFMALDPAAGPAADPRPALPTSFFASGLNRLFSRTDWGPEAAWFNYRLSWNSVDHQMADGNHFEFYRKGEWLTKGRTGYADIAEGIASSEFYNTVAIQNTRPDGLDDSDWRIDLWKRGSQWNIVDDGNPALLGYSFTDDYAYAAGDAVNLYNSTRQGSTDVTEASRAIVWLKPDFIVVYDRAETRSDGAFKRWWLQLARPAQVSGARAVSVTPGGQQLIVTILLPADARPQPVNNADAHVESTVAAGEPMTVRLMTEAPGAPRAVRFLHVLQGADAGTPAAAASLVQSGDGAWQGAAVNGAVVMFPVVRGQALGTLSYTAPAGTTRHYITGLTPGAGYTAQITATDGGLTVTITSGGPLTADAGGLLAIK